MKAYILDGETIRAFNSLYSGDITYYTTPGHIAMGMMDERGAVALLLATFDASDVWLDYLFVREDMRNMGLGTDFLNNFLEKINRLSFVSEVQVVCGQKTMDFLDRFGFDMELSPEFYTYSFPLLEVMDLGDRPPNKKIRKFLDLTPIEKRKLEQKLLDSGASIGVPLPLNAEDFSPASLCYGIEDIIALVLLREFENHVEVSYAYADKGSGQMMMLLVASSVAYLMEDYDDDTPLVMAALNEGVGKMIEKYTESYDKIGMYRGAFSLMRLL